MVVPGMNFSGLRIHFTTSCSGLLAAWTMRSW